MSGIRDCAIAELVRGSVLAPSVLRMHSRQGRCDLRRDVARTMDRRRPHVHGICSRKQRISQQSEYTWLLAAIVVALVEEEGDD